MAGREEERYAVKIIPENYATGLNLFGFNFKVRNFAEGVLIALVLGILMLLFWLKTKLFDVGTAIGLIVSFAGIGFVLGVIGINDEPISEFVCNMLRAKSHKRLTRYNSYPKDWTVPYFLEEEELNRNLPSEKVRVFLQKYREKIDKEELQRMVEYQNMDIDDDSDLFFTDMKGHVPTPVRFMGDKEFNKYKKEQKKLAKMHTKKEKEKK